MSGAKLLATLVIAHAWAGGVRHAQADLWAPRPEVFREARAPESLTLTDARGKRFSWSDLGPVPKLVVPVFASCPETCPTTLRRLARALGGLTLGSGVDYQVVALSFDPEDTSSDLLRLEERSGGSRAGWILATAPADQQRQWLRALDFVTESAGTPRQFNHFAGAFVVGARLGALEFVPEPAFTSERLGAAIDTARRVDGAGLWQLRLTRLWLNLTPYLPGALLLGFVLSALVTALLLSVRWLRRRSALRSP